MLNLDTHILIKALEGSLAQREKNVLANGPVWTISAIVLWELAKLHQYGRIRYSLDDQPMTSALSRIAVWPITRSVCATIATLDFRSDAADEIIAATSLAYDVPLLTRDARIRKSKLVRFAS